MIRKTPALGPTELQTVSYADLRITDDPATSTGTGPSRRLAIADVRYLKPGDQVYVRREIVGPVWEWFVAVAIRVFTFTKKDARPTVVNHVATVVAALHEFDVGLVPVRDLMLSDVHLLEAIDYVSRNDGVELKRDDGEVLEVPLDVALYGGEGLGPVVDWVIAEALGRGGFQYNRLLESYGDARRYSIAIARHQGATPEQRTTLLGAIEHLIGKSYGFLKVGANAVDYFATLAWNAFGGRGDVYLARRLCRMEDYPMCSWASLYVYDKAGLPFDVPISAGSPDDMWDESRAKSCDVWVWPYCSPSLKSDLYGPGFGDYELARRMFR